MTLAPIICPYCKKEVMIYIGYINQAKKKGVPRYCSKLCSGLSRKDNKSLEQKKKEKADYDRRYREVNKEIIDAKKRVYREKNIDIILTKQRVYNKKRMPLHVEYCRHPLYKKYKKDYDKNYRAKKMFGEFFEAAIILNDIEQIIDSREADKQNKLYLKSTTQKKRKNGNFKRN